MKTLPFRLTAWFALAAACFLALWHLSPTAPLAVGENVRPTRANGLAGEEFPRLDGSTSTQPLSWLLTCRALGLAGELKRLAPSAYGAANSVALTFPLDAAAKLVEEYARRQPYHRGTHAAYEQLARGVTDLILVAREPSPDELKTAAAYQVKFDLRPFALDALVILVNEKNPVDSLTQPQLRAVFTEKAMLWRTLGGEDFPVRVYTRNRNSGSQELMEKLVLQGRKIAAGDDVTMVDEMGEVIRRVAANRQAIGYSVFYYERVMNPSSQNKLIAVDGVPPSRRTIANGTYPLAAPVYLATRSDLESGAPAARWRDWLLSREGQKLVAQSGYVPLSP